MTADNFPSPRDGEPWTAQSAAKWQSLVDEVRTLKGIKVGKGLKLVKRQGTFRIELVERPRIALAGEAGIAEELAFIREQSDYLECETGEGGTINVAKPFLLRRTSFDGFTFGNVRYRYQPSVPSQRTVDRVGVTGSAEEQRITPSYISGDRITPMRVSGITENRGSAELLDANGNRVLFVSVDDPRLFAEVTF